MDGNLLNSSFPSPFLSDPGEGSCFLLFLNGLAARLPTFQGSVPGESVRDWLLLGYFGDGVTFSVASFEPVILLV